MHHLPVNTGGGGGCQVNVSPPGCSSRSPRSVLCVQLRFQGCDGDRWDSRCSLAVSHCLIGCQKKKDPEALK